MKKSHFKSLGEVIQVCTKSNYPFALYRLPGEQQIHCIANSSTRVELEPGMPFPSAPGFVFYPFQPESRFPACFINAGIHFSCLYKDVDLKDASADFNFDIPASESCITSEEMFCRQVHDAVEFIKEGMLKKVILSRVQNVNNMRKSPVAVFLELCGMFGPAFLSLVYIPGRTLWLTVSPELLIASNREEIKTVALAGTKKPNANWTEKELNEQKLVTGYIEKIVDKHCSKVKISETADVVAGSVVHLKTSFTARLDSGLWDLVMDLHPTPAVCGIPKDEALKFIRKTELHNRKYYSGFLGPYNIDGETNFFVNLRCAEIMHDKAALYIGGGITEESLPHAEWEETVMKTNTLLPVLESVSKPKVEHQ